MKVMRLIATGTDTCPPPTLPLKPLLLVRLVTLEPSQALAFLSRL